MPSQTFRSRVGGQTTTDAQGDCRAPGAVEKTKEGWIREWPTGRESLSEEITLSETRRGEEAPRKHLGKRRPYIEQPTCKGGRACVSPGGGGGGTRSEISWNKTEAR